MKIVRGLSIFLILGLAAYGVFALLKSSPNIHISEGDKAYLEGLGIQITCGQAEDSGLSQIFGNIEGAPPVGVPGVSNPGAASGVLGQTVASSSVPGILGGPAAPAPVAAASSVPPPFMSGMDSTPPFVAADSEPHQAAEFSTPPFELLIPSENAEQPADSSTPESSFDTPGFDLLPVDEKAPCSRGESESLDHTESQSCCNAVVLPHKSINSNLVHILPAPPGTGIGVTPISENSSPPPWPDSWDGPALDISNTLPPEKLLHSFNSFPQVAPTNHTTQSAVTHPIAEEIPPVQFQPTAHAGVRRIEHNPNTSLQHDQMKAKALPVRSVGYTSSVPTAPHVSSTSASSASSPPVKNIPASVRRPLTFEPVKPDVSATSTVVVFGSQRQANAIETGMPHDQTAVPAMPTDLPQADSLQQPVMIASPLLQDVQRQRGQRQSEQTMPTTANSSAISPLQRFLQSQQMLATSGEPNKIRQAFIELSQLYESGGLGEKERTMLYPLLDALASRVIYASDSHILEEPYRVKPGETVESIAKQFNLTPALLRKINGIGIHQSVEPGTILKVLYGQFDARISVNQKQLTLLLGGLYAGRFAFAMPQPIDRTVSHSNELFVLHKTGRLIVLNNGWTLGSAYGTDANFQFAEQNASELFDILSEQSVIVLDMLP